VSVLIRQAHPGPDVPPYSSFEEKMYDAERYQEDEDIPWPVLVDDLAGSVHQVYGGLSDPSYLIDADGYVSFYNMWTYAPAQHKAITSLIWQSERGIVQGGIDHTPYLQPALTVGWRGLRRGLMQSFTDLETAAPGIGVTLWLGYQLRALLAPFTMRARPLPAPVKAAPAIAGLFLLGRWLRRSDNNQ
jgi:hypothetical protein